MKRMGLVICSIVFGFIYTALSVWAWGSWSGFFSDPARAALIVVLFALVITAAFSNSSGIGSGVREDRSNRWIFVPLTVIGLQLIWLPPYLDRRNEWVWGGEVIRWIGLALSLAGGVLRIAPVFQLGRRFSGVVAIQEGHTLKTDGLYQVIRHPSYLGLLMSSFGWPLVFRCLVPGLIITAALVPPLIARMNSEEKLLSEQFGDGYAEYKKRTWRLIPRVY